MGPIRLQVLREDEEVARALLKTGPMVLDEGDDE